MPPQAAHYRCGSEVGALRQLLQVPHYLGGVITTWCNPFVCDECDLCDIIYPPELR